MLKSSCWLTWAALGLGLGLGYFAASTDLRLAGWGRGASPPAPPRTEQSVSRETRPAEMPNIVFMMADNLGYGELGCYGGGILRGAPTPRIDKFAREGLRLLNYNVEAQCTPSRSALLTGRLSIRSGTMRVNRGGALYGLTQWEITLAEVLAEQGYATALFGKWHLGATEGRFPTNQGFDQWFGIPNSTSVAPWPSAVGFDPKVAPVPHNLKGR